MDHFEDCTSSAVADSHAIGLFSVFFPVRFRLSSWQSQTAWVNRFIRHRPLLLQKREALTDKFAQVCNPRLIPVSGGRTEAVVAVVICCCSLGKQQKQNEYEISVHTT